MQKILNYFLLKATLYIDLYEVTYVQEYMSKGDEDGKKIKKIIL